MTHGFASMPAIFAVEIHLGAALGSLAFHDRRRRGVHGVDSSPGNFGRDLRISTNSATSLRICSSLSPRMRAACKAMTSCSGQAFERPVLIGGVNRPSLMLRKGPLRLPSVPPREWGAS